MYRRNVDVVPENVLTDIPALFERQDANAFKIRSGKLEKLRFPAYFHSDWKDGGDPMDEFKTFVDRVSRNRDASVFSITFYRLPDDARYWEDGEVVGEYTFRVYDGEVGVVGAVSKAGDVYAQLANLQAENQILRMKLEQLEEAMNEEPEEEKPAVGWVMDVIKDEQARQAVVGLVGSVVQNIVSIVKGYGGVALPAAVSGLSEATEIVNELRKYDAEIENDLKRLLKLAKDNNALFNSLLSQLRQIVPL